jgi:hypothetical protein
MSRTVAVQPSASAASAAALTGIAALGDAWLGERSAIFLALAAIRTVGSGGRYVPWYSLSTSARDSVSTSTGGALPDRNALGDADAAGRSTSSLQAAVPAARPARATSATSVRTGRTLPERNNPRGMETFILSLTLVG